MYKWILPTLSEILALCESTLKDCTPVATENSSGNILSSANSTTRTTKERIKAKREWRGAIAALEQLLQSMNSDIAAANVLAPAQGLVMAGPVPVLSHAALLSSLSKWIFAVESLPPGAGAFQLPPTAMPRAQTSSHKPELVFNTGSVLPLLPADPLANEQFCLVLTAKFSLVMVLGEDRTGRPAFLFSFEPEVVEQAWQALRGRVLLRRNPDLLSQLDSLVESYYPVAPDYRTVTQFSRLLIKHLPLPAAEDGEMTGAEGNPAPSSSSSSHRSDVELLQAFAHEVRTPLTTIRTLTRLLLKRRDLGTDVVKRLEIIDHECTEQIDRMELLFRAAELETSAVKHTSTHLTPMSLSQILQQSIPRWEKQASRRNLTLDIVLPQQLPTVISDPRMLDQVLTGLIENFTRSLPAGSHLQVQIIPAGDQLKLQLLPQSQSEEVGEMAERLPFTPTQKSLGQLLMFQPETGSISLNLAATKHLFQAIGGKLIVRQRPHQDEVLTIFLPLDLSHTELCH